MKNERGISLVELIVAISLLMLVVALSTSSYQKWQRSVQVVNSTEELRSVLLYSQQLSTAAAKNDTWGVHLEEDYFVMFKGSFYNETDPDNKISLLNGTLIVSPTSTFANGAGGYGADVVFYKFTGETANTGTVSIGARIDPSINKSIIIESSGKINYE